MNNYKILLLEHGYRDSENEKIWIVEYRCTYLPLGRKEEKDRMYFSGNWHIYTREYLGKLTQKMLIEHITQQLRISDHQMYDTDYHQEVMPLRPEIVKVKYQPLFRLQE